MNQRKGAINSPITKRSKKTGRAFILVNVVIEKLQEQYFGQSVSNAAETILIALHFGVYQLYDGPDRPGRLERRKVHHLRQRVEYRVRCSLIEIHQPAHQAIGYLPFLKKRVPEFTGLTRSRTWD